MLSGAEAVFRALAFAPGRGWLLAAYRHVPGFATVSERCYAFIAAHRSLFFRLTKLLFGPIIEPASYARVQWLFSKALGAIYGIAFLSLWSQITGLIGSQGILPIGLYLSRISESFGASRYWNFPTVFWIGSSDLALTLVCAAGVLFSILLIAGILERAALIACWALYLSLTTAGQDFLSFQWDILLLEAGFLAIFLGFSPLVVWLFRWLLFRLMLLSGAVKLLSGDSAWRALDALKFHYQTQPLPTPAAWYMQQLPGWFQQASVMVMFAIELGAPLLIFAPRRARFFAGFWILFLQILILLTGNYTFFNLLTMALCIPLLDDQALAGRTPPSAADPTAGFLRRHAASVIAAILIPISSAQLVAQFYGRMPYPAEIAQRLLAPWNLTSNYGLFAVMTTVRHEIVIEGSNDGASWREYAFRYKPGDVSQPPHWAAPHQPRLDWQMWFAALGSYRNNPWLVNFVFRLLQGAPQVTALLAGDPFPAVPPRYIRALVYDYTFTDWQTRHTTGAWWKREFRGTYLPAVSLDNFRPPE
jgi:lipase maturation factor 1